MSYRAPVSEIAFTLYEVAGFRDLLEEGLFPSLTPDLVGHILSEAGRFATEEIAPINEVGDREPPRLADGVVTMSEAYRTAYRRWIENGWSALTGDPAYDGQGLPQSIATAVGEMWNQASVSFALNPLLSMGAIEAIEAHATDELKAAYLPKLISGEWTGTMNLTEPQSGSDLGGLRTRAERAGDGTYRIFGQKIYITYGEHDLSENIVHLVLARLPDAPEGTRGISLFLVPKRLVNADGSLGARNDVRAAGLEHKLGIHGSPTCTMVYGDAGGAIGYRIGEENQGLRCMFTMMNNARLAVGMQGAAIAERATQHAFHHARERRQGRAVGWTGEGMAPIVYHPDVKRMLLQMRSMTGAARSICYVLAVAIDRAKHGAEADRATWQARADLLTPIAKAFSTDVGVEVASTGVQVFGGMGFIEETGAARFYRDARIFPIYEGTNGIQAIDLVTRKLPLGDGAAVRDYIGELRRECERVRGANDLDLGETAAVLGEALDAVEGATERMLAWLAGDDASREKALAGATPYLRAFGIAAGGVYLAKGALAARAGAEGSAAAYARAVAARFFAEQVATGVPGIVRGVMDGSGTVADLEPDLIEA